jgi:hypothetical protein
MDDADVRAFFEQFGTITDFVRMVDKATGRGSLAAAYLSKMLRFFSL